ncbi:hypothetical protein CKF54_04285 [Psittacicella hinzii]|uniref:Uncharacterized protein n=1 Tax=Psittacicella hinzii TaxID=2028575 RepID=A0A3A1Y5X8_9GAMM|nr:hypothetical protein CKF54_04285 [Psittacicella hinzii]
MTFWQDVFARGEKFLTSRVKSATELEELWQSYLLSEKRDNCVALICDFADGLILAQLQLPADLISETSQLSELDLYLAKHQAYAQLLQGLNLNQIKAVEFVDLRAGSLLRPVIPQVGLTYNAQVTELDIANNQAFVDLITEDKAEVSNQQYWQALLKLSDCKLPSAKIKSIKEVVQNKQKLKVRLKSPAYSDKLALVSLAQRYQEINILENVEDLSLEDYFINLLGRSTFVCKRLMVQAQVVFVNRVQQEFVELGLDLQKAVILDNFTLWQSKLLPIVQALALNPQEKIKQEAISDFNQQVKFDLKQKQVSKEWNYVFTGLDYTDKHGLNYLVSQDQQATHIDLNKANWQKADLTPYQTQGNGKSKVEELFKGQVDINMQINLTAMPTILQLIELTKANGQINIDLLPIQKKHRQLFAQALDLLVQNSGLGKNLVLQSKHPFKDYLTASGYLEIQRERKGLNLGHHLTALEVNKKNLLNSFYNFRLNLARCLHAEKVREATRGNNQTSVGNKVAKINLREENLLEKLKSLQIYANLTPEQQQKYLEQLQQVHRDFSFNYQSAFALANFNKEVLSLELLVNSPEDKLKKLDSESMPTNLKEENSNSIGLEEEKQISAETANSANELSDKLQAELFVGLPASFTWK